MKRRKMTPEQEARSAQLRRTAIARIERAGRTVATTPEQRADLRRRAHERVARPPA
jgi:hypothetical protein